MKKITIALFLALMACGQLFAKSYKRGVCENQFVYASQMSPLEDGVSWYYNWGNTPGNGYDGEVIGYEGFDFIPMCWNGNFNSGNIRQYLQTHPNVKYILGFNEPNFTAQANMTPQQAAAKWPEVVAIAKEFNLKTVAPALNWSPNPPYTDPTKWMDEFTSLVGNDAYDFVAVHGYGGFGSIESLATTFHERYGKDVWVTEFCYWPGESGYVKPQAQINAMVSIVNWLEKTDWIYRYAWFKATGAHNSTNTANFGLIVSRNGKGDRELSPQGKIYTYMSEFDKEKWYGPGERFNAVDYVDANLLSLGVSEDRDCGKPIEISQFSAGASVDWQVEAPSAGEYLLRLHCTGVGEPDRFDPRLKVQEIMGDKCIDLCKTTTFSLPGNESDYVDRDILVSLTEGRHVIRLVDDAPYSPSGIRISSVMLLSKEAGVDEISTPNPERSDVYSLQGIRLLNDATKDELSTRLPAGIYIYNGEKIRINN